MSLHQANLNGREESSVTLGLYRKVYFLLSLTEFSTEECLSWRQRWHKAQWWSNGIIIRKIQEKYYFKNLGPCYSHIHVVKSTSYLFSGVRPFGVSLLICGWDEDRPYLFQCDPSGAYFAWKATAMGKNFISARTFLEKRLVNNVNFKIGWYFFILCLFHTN